MSRPSHIVVRYYPGFHIGPKVATFPLRLHVDAILSYDGYNSGSRIFVDPRVAAEMRSILRHGDQLAADRVFFYVEESVRELDQMIGTVGSPKYERATREGDGQAADPLRSAVRLSGR